MRAWVFVASGALVLGACSDASNDDAAADGSEGASESAETAEDSSQTEDADDAEGEDQADAEDAAEPEAGKRARFTSAYAELDLDRCDVLTSSEEYESVTWRCSNMRGVPIFVQSGDLRYDLDAGVDNNRFETISAFNDLNSTIEIRMDGGKPFAVIFRFLDTSMESPNRSVLAVEQIGTARSPGCRVAQIAGNTPRANERAREIADRTAGGFDCSREPEMVGNAG